MRIVAWSWTVPYSGVLRAYSSGAHSPHIQRQVWGPIMPMFWEMRHLEDTTRYRALEEFM